MYGMTGGKISELERTQFDFFGDVHDIALWARHPDIQRVVAMEVMDADDRLTQRTGIWLAPDRSEFADSSVAKTDRPDREPDLEVGGDGMAPSDAFWNRCPGLEHLELASDLPGEMDECPAGWWHARLWLHAPPAPPFGEAA